MLGVIARVGGRNRQATASMVGNIRSLAERAGRNDLKAGYGAMEAIVANMAGTETADEAPKDINGRIVALPERLRKAVVEAGRSTDNPTLLRNKPKSVGNITRALINELDVEVQNLANYNTQLTAARQTGSPEAIAQINAQVQATEANIGSVRAKIENMRETGLIGYGPEVNMQEMSNQVYGNVKNPAPGATRYNENVRATVPDTTTRGQAPAGQVLPTGQPYIVPGQVPRYDVGPMQQAYQEEKIRRPTDPNDPNNPLNRP
jgi:hypothetical protein